MKIFLNNFEESGSKITKNQVSKILNQVVEDAGFKKKYFDNKELSISCVTKEESKILNKKYRGINKSTNVLSFRVDKNLTKYSLIGDIILLFTTFLYFGIPLSLYLLIAASLSLIVKIIVTRKYKDEHAFGSWIAGFFLIFIVFQEFYEIVG